MNHVRFAALAAGVVFLLGASPRDPGRDALQGSWAAVSLRVNGDDVPADHLKGGHLAVKGDRYAAAFAADETETVYALAVDPSKSPAALDLTFADGPKKGMVLKGVYRVAGDSLTICRGLTESDPRPDGFDAPAGSNRVLAVWTRAQPPTASAKAAGPVRADVARELARFQGVWRMTSASSDGQAVPDAQVKKVTVTYNGSKHTVRIGDQVVAHDVGFEVDPSAEPKAVTDTVLEGPEAGMVIRGIYKLEGDTLVSCVAGPNQDRPKAFDASAGTGRSLRTFRREPPPDPAVAAEQARLQGTWSVASMELDGLPTPADSLAGSRLVFDGRKFTAEAGGGAVHGTYKLDLAKSPRAIDVAFTDGPDAGRSALGVYEVDGNSVRICLAPAGKPRPLGFVSRPGTGHTLEVLKR